MYYTSIRLQTVKMFTKRIGNSNFDLRGFSHSFEVFKMTLQNLPKLIFSGALFPILLNNVWGEFQKSLLFIKIKVLHAACFFFAIFLLMFLELCLFLEFLINRKTSIEISVVYCFSCERKFI